MVIDTSWIPILFVAGLSLVVLSILMLGVCYWYRRKRSQREQKRKEVVEKYRPLLFDWIGGETPPLDEPGSTMEWIHLIALWNDLYEKVGSSSHENLRDAAEELALDDRAVQMVDSNETEKQLTGVITLGHLEDKRRLNRIEELTESSITILKMQSIKALVILEPKEALEKIYDDLIENPNQSPNYYLGFCRSIETDALMDVTFERLETVDSSDKSRIIPFLELARNEPARKYLREQLKSTDQPEISSACLKVLRKIGTPADQTLVTRFLSNDADFVRTQAARTLGSIGTSEAVEPLIDTLGDPNWWVRYRAAESLVKLPSTSLDDLESILSRLTGTDPKKALQSAISEVEV